MAQGDLTVLNYAAGLVLDRKYALSFKIGVLDPSVTAKVDDGPNEINQYRTKGTTWFVAAAPSQSSNIAYFRAYQSVFFDRNPDVPEVYQFLIFDTSSYTGPIAFIDATEDGGRTPHNLATTPIRVQFGGPTLYNIFRMQVPV